MSHHCAITPATIICNSINVVGAWDLLVREFRTPELPLHLVYSLGLLPVFLRFSLISVPSIILVYRTIDILFHFLSHRDFISLDCYSNLYIFSNVFDIYTRYKTNFTF